MSRRKPSRRAARRKARLHSRPKYRWVTVRRRPWRTRLLRLGIALGVLAVLGAAGFGIRRAMDLPDRGPTTRSGSVALTTTAPIPRVAPPLAYDAEYRIEESATATGVTTYQRTRVRRPFDSRVEIRNAGGRLLETRITALGKLTIGAQTRRVLGVPPSLGTGDLRPDPVLDEAVEKGWLQRREQRRVAGRRCQVYRAGKTVLSGQLIPLEAAAQAEHADVCIDAAGLVLEEVWQAADGRRVRRRVATRINTAPRLDDSVFSFEGIEGQPLDQGGGEMRPVDPGRPLPSDLWMLDTVPDGFTLLGRYAVLHPNLEPATGNPLQEETRPRGSSFADVWVRGPDLLVLDRGQGAAFSSGPTDRELDLGAIGRGVVSLDLRTSEVHATPPGGYLRLYGTLGTDQLVALARQLRRHG